MSDFEKIKQIERGKQLLQEAEVLCNSHPRQCTEAFEKSVQALEIFQDSNEKKLTESVCYLLKGIGKVSDIDVEKELGDRGINFKKVCRMTDAEINKKLLKQSRR